MKLRNHPLMSRRGIRNWPPVWTWIGGEENKHPKAEVGVLSDVKLSTIEPRDRCFLVMEYKGSSYMGSLLFDDSSFCDGIFTLLRTQVHRSIEYIGGLDLSYTL